MAIKAYDIQCQQADATEMVAWLKTLTKLHPFCFHRIWHKDKQVYSNVSCKHNSFLAQNHIVPIQGIDDSLKIYIETETLQINGVVDMLQHKATSSNDWWSIMTNAANFH